MDGDIAAIDYEQGREGLADQEQKIEHDDLSLKTY
jgi:hypothetical protein